MDTQDITPVISYIFHQTVSIRMNFVRRRFILTTQLLRNGLTLS